MDREMKDQIRRLIADLASGRYAQIVASGRSGRLSEAELRTAVETYGRRLIPLPDKGWGLVDVYPQEANPSCSAGTIAQDTGLAAIPAGPKIAAARAVVRVLPLVAHDLQVGALRCLGALPGVRWPGLPDPAPHEGLVEGCTPSAQLLTTSTPGQGGGPGGTALRRRSPGGAGTR
jgi:hypothetical protein